MMKGLLTAVLLAGLASGANATEFTFSYAGSGVSGSGTLTASPSAGGEYEVTGGTGTTTVAGAPNESGSLTFVSNHGFPNQGLSPSGSFYYDDAAFPSTDPVVTNSGLLFTVPSGVEVNIYSNGPGNYVYADNAALYPNGVPVSFDLTEVPEPATLAVLGTGALALGLVRRWRLTS